MFYYKDETGKILYLDGSKNIRRKVITDFQKPADSPEKTRMFELMRNIDYELSGNEFTAKLLAHRELKKHLPEFNKIPKPNSSLSRKIPFLLTNTHSFWFGIKQLFSQIDRFSCIIG